MNVTDAELERVREWAHTQLRAENPPWVWYQHMKLIEAISAIH